MTAQDVQRIKLSGSTDGKGILIAATASTGTTVHTAHATSVDYLTLYASNNNAANKIIYVEWGETAANKQVIMTIPAKSGEFPIFDRKLITNSLVVTIYAETASCVNIGGHCDRVT